MYPTTLCVTFVGTPPPSSRWDDPSPPSLCFPSSPPIVLLPPAYDVISNLPFLRYLAHRPRNFSAVLYAEAHWLLFSVSMLILANVFLVAGAFLVHQIRRARSSRSYRKWKQMTLWG